MKKVFFLLLFSYAVFLDTSCYGIKNIPQKDQQILEYFFAFLIRNTSIGYSLCGEKPIAIETIPNLSRIPSTYFIHIFFNRPSYSILSGGWDIWSCYASQFFSHNFVFRFNRQNNTLVLINKQAAGRVIRSNLEIFQNVFGEVYSANEVLQKICYPEDHDYLFNHSKTCLGLLLGYGKNNSIAFDRYRCLKKLEHFSLYSTPRIISWAIDPGLMILNDNFNISENKHVKKTFKAAKMNLYKNFKDGNYFETFIRLFTAPKIFQSYRQQAKGDL